MNGSNLVVDDVCETATKASGRRWMKVALAAYCVTHLVDAGAVPITMTSHDLGSNVVFYLSPDGRRYGDFALHDSNSAPAQFAKFDSSLGTLLSAELTLNSSTSHPTLTRYLQDVSGGPTQLAFGALAQDTEREIHGIINQYAYYDARTSYRADYRLTLDAFNTDLFTATAAEAAFGSCQREEDLLFDIGDQNPVCRAGNDGSPLGDYSYSWGALTGTQLSQFIGNDPLLFSANMVGDAYGHCDDDVGDYCIVNFSMVWNWDLALSYTYEPVVSGGGGDGWWRWWRWWWWWHRRSRIRSRAWFAGHDGPGTSGVGCIATASPRFLIRRRS